MNNADKEQSADVSERLIDKIEANCRLLYKGIVPPSTDYRQIACDVASLPRAREEIDRLLTGAGTDGHGKRMLEIGSGYGLVLAVARAEFGLEAFGIEPAEQFSGSFQISQEILQELGCPKDAVQCADGESLPFEDSSFDIVYSSNVLEHVSDTEKVISEALRVLRPGGHFCFIVPNYGSWWEGHYGVLWFPHITKGLAKLYIRLLGRDPAFIDTLQFVTRKSLEKIVGTHAHQVEVLGWGEDIWEHRLRTLDFSQWALLGTVHRIAGWLHRLKIVGLVVWLGRRLHWETPLILTLLKRR